MRNILRDACGGDIPQLRHYKDWPRPGGFLESWKKTASAKVQYLNGLGAFMSFMLCRKSNIMKPAEYNEAKAQFARWSAALRKDKNAQQVAVAARAQQSIPAVASLMGEYTEAQQCRYFRCGVVGSVACVYCSGLAKKPSTG
jgi:precorrin-3B methylase